jgi:hypothetical protein
LKTGNREHRFHGASELDDDLEKCNMDGWMKMLFYFGGKLVRAARLLESSTASKRIFDTTRSECELVCLVVTLNAKKAHYRRRVHLGILVSSKLQK